jgi:hypothetical protein
LETKCGFGLAGALVVDELDQIGGIGLVQRLDDRPAFSFDQAEAGVGFADVDHLQQLEPRWTRRPLPLVT